MERSQLDTAKELAEWKRLAKERLILLVGMSIMLLGLNAFSWGARHGSDPLMVFEWTVLLAGACVDIGCITASAFNAWDAWKSEKN